MNSDLITVNKLSKSYPSRQGKISVLYEIDLLIKKFEMTAIVGVSGSGKTTLLNLLGCLDRPDSGKIFYGSEEVTTLSNMELADYRNRHVGFVFQRFHLIPDLFSVENVLLPLRIAGISGTETMERAAKVLKDVDLEDKLWSKPSELSAGQMQRVAIARAIVNSPRVLLADEPTGNLDSSTANEIANLLENLTAREMAVVVATHNLELARRCAKCYELKNGRLQETNP